MKRRKMDPNSLRNLRPFGTLPPEEQRELSRRGGVASGERRREIADLRSELDEMMIASSLIHETREEYRRAVKRYAAEERRKAKRRKPK